MNNESKLNEFKTKKEELMKQYMDTFTSIAQQLKICDNPYEEQSKQNILRKDVLEFLKISQQLLNLSNEIKKHVILNEDIYQTNDEYKLSEKDLLEIKQNIRFSYENKQKEMEAQIKERQQRSQNIQQYGPGHPQSQVFPQGSTPQGQGQNFNMQNQYQRQGQQPHSHQQQTQQPAQQLQQQQPQQPHFPGQQQQQPYYQQQQQQQNPQAQLQPPQFQYGTNPPKQ